MIQVESGSNRNLFEHAMGFARRNLRALIERDPDFPLRGRTSLSPSEKLRVMVGSWLRPV